MYMYHTYVEIEGQDAQRSLTWLVAIADNIYPLDIPEDKIEQILMHV